MRIGYGRTSTLEQQAGLDAQTRDLEKAGCDPDYIFVEKLSSIATTRPKLEEALTTARKGDEFLVKKIDRLARSVADFVQIEKRLSAKGVTLKVLDGGIDTSTPTGRLQMNLLVSIAQFEREIMLERQKEGIAKAKEDGKYKGRNATAQKHAADVLALSEAGKQPADIVKALKTKGHQISLASVYRIIAAAKAEAKLNEAA